MLFMHTELHTKFSKSAPMRCFEPLRMGSSPTAGMILEIRQPCEKLLKSAWLTDFSLELISCQWNYFPLKM